MSLIPLLPVFHKFNRQFFDQSLTTNREPLVKVRWSDNRLKTTAGFYKRKQLKGVIDSEIILEAFGQSDWIVAASYFSNVLAQIGSVLGRGETIQKLS